MPIDRRSLFAAGLGATLAGGAFVRDALAQDAPQDRPPMQDPDRDGDRRDSDRGDPDGRDSVRQDGDRPDGDRRDGYHRRMDRPDRAESYSHDEIVHGVSDFFGVASENVGGVVERIFEDNGAPTAYISGEEGSGAIGVGLRYGKGLLYMKRRSPMRIFWRGPSVGWDFGGNASRVFTLAYNLQYPEAIFQRFPGVDGSLYFIAGLGVNYQRANDITLAPIRSGVGLRAGANVGYLAYSRSSHWFPF